MDETKKDGSIFELGILIGRLSQLGADNGIVKKDGGIGIIDVIETTTMVLEDTQLKDDVISQMNADLVNIQKLLDKYEINATLSDEDSAKIIKYASCWRRKISDELSIEDDFSSVNPDNVDHDV